MSSLGRILARKRMLLSYNETFLAATASVNSGNSHKNERNYPINQHLDPRSRGWSCGRRITDEKCFESSKSVWTDKKKKKKRWFSSTPSGGRRGTSVKSPALLKMARALEGDSQMALELISELNKDTQIRIANAILDTETQSGKTYSDYLATKTRRSIMIREISISLGQDVKDQIDLNHDGHVSSEEFNEFLKNVAKIQEKEKPAAAPTRKQLQQLALLSGIPFIGFGFLDNAIMLIAGDVIDTTIGRVLGISTLAAAGLGNLISDVAGLGLGGYIEASARRLGLKDPKLTLKQMNTRQVRLLQFFATSIGITIGCLLGMVPLFFMDQEEKAMMEMFEILDTDDDDRVTVGSLLRLIDENKELIGQVNTVKIHLKVKTEFGDPNEELTFRRFRKVITSLREENLLEKLPPRKQFGKDFCEAVLG